MVMEPVPFSYGVPFGALVGAFAAIKDCLLILKPRQAACDRARPMPAEGMRSPVTRTIRTGSH